MARQTARNSKRLSMAKREWNGKIYKRLVGIMNADTDATDHERRTECFEYLKTFLTHECHSRLAEEWDVEAVAWSDQPGMRRERRRCYRRHRRGN